MNGFSIIMPYDPGRGDLFKETVLAYEEFGIPEDCELIIVTRHVDKQMIPWSHYFKVIHYEHEGEYFNPALALNIGVENAKYDNIIITCPEVKPITNVLEQLQESERSNYVCQVFDETPDKVQGKSLVNSDYRSGTPSMYFLACFKKEDLYLINGWDERFMQGYAYEDDDFGSRFVRAGLRFEMRDDIKALHQWHPRGSLGTVGAKINRLQFEENNRNGVTSHEFGLRNSD